MITPRLNHTATLLANGSVLIADGNNNTAEIASAELYNTATCTFSSTGSLNVARTGHLAATLNNGNVLIIGGSRGTSAPIGVVELYTPATGKFTATGSLNTARSGCTATLLPSGQVLVTGGENAALTDLASAEIYTPSTGKFTYTGSLNTARYSPTATLLQDGTVLIAGGGIASSNGQTMPVTATAEIYTPSAGTFAYTGQETGTAATPAVGLSSGAILFGNAPAYKLSRYSGRGCHSVYVPSGYTPGEVYTPSNHAFTAGHGPFRLQSATARYRAPQR